MGVLGTVALWGCMPVYGSVWGGELPAESFACTGLSWPMG